MNYLIGLLASIIGILVIVLRLQGGRLHEAQIKMLLTVVDRNQGSLDAAVQAARVQLNASLKAYYEASDQPVPPADQHPPGAA